MTRNHPFRITACAFGVAALLASAGCTGQHSRSTVQNDDTPEAPKVAMVSSLAMNAPSAPGQLMKGFGALENGQWRWAAGGFSVKLKTPSGASEKGATLSLALSVSDAVLKQVQSQMLTASVGGQKLGSETYTQSGAHVFKADMPTSVLTGDSLTIDFALDHPLPPSASDRRELGVIVSSVGIESK